MKTASKCLEGVAMKAENVNPQLLKDKGNEAFGKGDFHLAKDLYSKGIYYCTRDSAELLGTLYSNRSMCHLQLSDLKQALKDGEDAILLRPTWPRGYLRKALALYCKGDMISASDCINHGLENDPKDEALISLARSIEESTGGENQKVQDAEEGVIKEAVEMLQSAGVSSSMPVTVLSGFLGSGKTTLLKRILTEEHGRRIAVIVNDMADVNIDAELIRNSGRKHGLSKVSEEVVELSNGCVCCTLRGDLIQEASRLVATQAFDLLVIESTGVSEPMPVAATFTTEDASGATLNKYFTIDNMLTVVDALRFTEDLKCGDALRDRSMEAFETDERTVAHLLVDQIEFASTILLNKCDLVPKESANKLEKFIRELNKTAYIVRTEHCQVPMDVILDTKRFDLSAAHQVPGFDTELQTNHTPETEEYGIRSMFYSASRPFHPQRLYDTVYAGGGYDSVSRVGPESFLNKVLRSKGFFYLAHNLDTCFEWSTAGKSCNYSISGQWISSNLSKDSWPMTDPDWTQDFGDRRQGIVFIGENLSTSDVQSTLDACLLTDEEIGAGESAWKKYGDSELWAMEVDSEDGEDEENDSSLYSTGEDTSCENDN